MRIDEIVDFRGRASLPKRIVGCSFPDVVCAPEDDLSGIEFIGCDLSKLQMSKEQFLSIKSIESSKAPKITLTQGDDCRGIDFTRADLTNVDGVEFNHLWQARGGLLTTKLRPDVAKKIHSHPDMVEYRFAIYQQMKDPDSVPLGYHEENAYLSRFDRY